MAITGLSTVRSGKKVWPKSQDRLFLLGLFYCSCSKIAILYARILHLTETRWIFLVGPSGGVRKHILSPRDPAASSIQVFPGRHVWKSLSIQYEQITRSAFSGHMSEAAAWEKQRISTGQTQNYSFWHCSVEVFSEYHLFLLLVR